MATDRNWEPIVPPGMEHILPPRELWITPHEAFVHYSRWIWEWRIYLTAYAKLRHEDRVLEIGCNHGRTMLGLLQYLRRPGFYCGFDIQQGQIDYARQNVAGDAFDVDFRYAPVHNAHYNPEGTVPAEEFVFDYPDASFDVCYAASVFTHMLTRPTANYLKQVGRVLAPGGRALFSMLLLDHYRGEGTSSDGSYEFLHELDGEPGLAVVDPYLPEAYTGYTLDALRHMAKEAGLRIQEVVPGNWSGSFESSVCEQDLVVFVKD